MKVVVLLLCLTSAACMSGTEHVDVGSSTQTVLISGTGNIDINLTFIQQLIDLCKQSLLPEDFATTELYNQAVANCVINSAKSIDPAQVQSVLNSTK